MTTTDERRPAVELAKPNPKLPDGITAGEVSGTYGGPTSGYVRTLVDRARTLTPTRALNGNTINLMRRHYQISSCLTVQSLPLVRADWSIECDDDDEREYLTAAYSRVAFHVHRTMTRALAYGYSPNALVLDYDNDLGGLVWTEVRDLDPTTCKPITDDRGTLDGFVQNPYGLGADEEPIDPAVTLWIVEGLEAGNYYGRSLLTAALDPWSDHLAIRAFHARYLERFGEPVVMCRAPDGQSIENLAEINAAVAANEPPPEPVLVDNVTAAREIGENLRHHSVVALPSSLLFGADGKPTGYAWTLEYVEQSGSSAEAFLNTLQELDKRIARGMFVPDLLIANSDTGAYALGQSHRSVWSEAVEGRLDDYSRQITDQVVDPLRRFNFGDDAPRARLVFAPLTDGDRDQLWTLATTLVEGGKLPLDVLEVAARLGIPVADDALEQIANPPAPTPAAGEAGAHAGRSMSGPGHLVSTLADQDVGTLPDWKLPQSYNPPPFRRPLNARERRVGFANLETGLNSTEARVVSALETILERERARVEKQLTGIWRKGTPAEILEALGTLEIKGGPEVSRAWSELMSDVGTTALDALRGELSTYADALPERLTPATRAAFKAYAQTSAERVLSSLTTEVRLELLNAYTSSVSRAGMASVVSQVFDAYEGNEGKGPRLTTRMLSSKALNYSRAAAVEAGGIPLAGAQYSAILDRRTCDLCVDLDETVIAIEHTDLARFTPPVHHNCRCVWVWITRDEPDFTPTWSTPASSKVDRYGGLVIG